MRAGNGFAREYGGAVAVDEDILSLCSGVCDRRNIKSAGVAADSLRRALARVKRRRALDLTQANRACNHRISTKASSR
jgi:hypothetical protein